MTNLLTCDWLFIIIVVFLYKNYEINKFKEEFGIVDEGEIVSEEDLEGEKDG